MVHTSPAEIDPILGLANEFALSATRLPQVPIAPRVGVVALRAIEEDRLTPEGFATFPDALQEPHFALIDEIIVGEHEPRGLRLPSHDAQRRAAGFVATSLLTSVTELFAGPNGEHGRALATVHRPYSGDPQIAAATRHLHDEERRATVLGVLEAADRAVQSPRVDTLAARYRSDITHIAHTYGRPRPSDSDFAAMQADLSQERRWLSLGLQTVLLDELGAAVQGRRVQLTDRQIAVATRNLTRWQVAPEWFAPAP